MRKNERRALLVIAGLAAIPLAQVEAGGRKEDPIRLAQDLFIERRVNEAILVLEEAVRDDPDQALEAEALLRKIRAIRVEYNDVLAQLLDTLENDPGDFVGALALIDRLVALDPFPNERLAREIESYRRVAQLAFDRNAVAEALDQADALVAERRYREALGVLAAARGAQRLRFDERGYGNIFVANVAARFEGYGAAERRFLAGFDAYRTATEAVVAAGPQLVSSAQSIEAFTSALADGQELLAALDLAETNADAIGELREEVRTRFPDDPIDWYLTLEEYLTRGRLGRVGNEGLVFVLRRAYLDQLDDVGAVAWSAARERFESAAGEFRATDYREAGSGFVSSGNAASLWLRALAAQAGVPAIDPESIAVVVAEGAPRSARAALVALAHRAAAESLGAAMSLLWGLPPPPTAASVQVELDTSRDRSHLAVANVVGGRDEWRQGAARRGELGARVGADRAADLDRNVARLWGDVVARVVERGVELTIAAGQTRTAGNRDALNDARARLADAEPLIAGVQQSIDGSDELVRIVRAPSRALPTYRALIATLEEAIARSDQVLATLEVTPPIVLEEERMVAERDRSIALDAELRAALDAVQADLASAEELIASSADAERLAVERIVVARQAIERLRVADARAALQQAQDFYVSALEFDESDALRQRSDRVVAEVAEGIRYAENQLVVARVRRLIGEAEDFYSQDEYALAQDTLLEARQVWEQTNVEQNPEIERLLRLATAALSFEQESRLVTSDTLYPVLAPFLSNAQQDFATGVSLWEDERVDDANQRFDRAITNVQTIRQQRPANREARLIELRIVQVRARDEFPQVFQARVNQALQRAREGEGFDALADLSALAEIDPNFPGLAQAIVNLEIQLDLRPNPVDAARTQAAAALVSQARGLSDGTADQVRRAIELLEQALTLNPDNGQATLLLDTLRIRTGGQATVALTTASEQQFRRALTLFSQDSVLQARAIVQRLLADPQNRSYPPLLDLQRRIQLSSF